jgi:7-carboxy-7-deazaguanine synthase
MTYSIKEIFMTLQGEGANAGKAALFIRFAGCNLWSGLEKDRINARCTFCDTDFVGTDGAAGGKYKNADDVVTMADSLWTGGHKFKYCVLTGGEPLLQLDKDLIDALHNAGYVIAIETNGTLPVPKGVDWICVSPKAGEVLQVFRGDELKLVYPQDNAPPSFFDGLDFKYFYLQPMDGINQAENTKKAIDFCLKNAKWQLSVQTHKILGID